MKNIRVAFDIKKKDTKISPGYSYLHCHLIFYVKMDFTQKDRFFANGSATTITSTSIYAGVVPIETVRIAFMYT